MSYREFKQWLYRGNRPHTLARILNRAWAMLHARGIAPGYLVTLEVPGRRTGKPISFPLVMTEIDGERYLVSMLGNDVAWIANVTAAKGSVTLRHGIREPIRLEELAVEKRPPVLKKYLQRAPGARPHFPIDKDAPTEAFDAIAADFPVFLVRSGSKASLQ